MANYQEARIKLTNTHINKLWSSARNKTGAILTVIWGEGVILLPRWFSLNNSETVKAATPAFFSIQLHLVRDVHGKFGVPYLPQSPNIGQNSDWYF